MTRKKHTHGIDAKRVRALEHSRNTRVQLQNPAAPDDGVTVTESGVSGRTAGAWRSLGKRSSPEPRAYFQSTVLLRSAGPWLELYMADTFQPEPNRLTDLEKQSL